MGKTSRRKGASYERDLARQFREMGWNEAKRHLEYQGQEAEEGRDLDGTQPWAVQAKCWGKNPSITAIEEITLSNGYEIPLAILKRSKAGQQPLEVAVLHWEDFKRLIAEMISSGVIEPLE